MLVSGPQWVVYSPEGVWENVADGETYAATIARLGGPEALRQWRELDAAMKPLQVGAGRAGGTCWRGGKGFDGVGMAGSGRLQLGAVLRPRSWGLGEVWAHVGAGDRGLVVWVW